MARKKASKEERIRWHHSLSDETKQSIWAVISFALAGIFALAALDMAGILGEKLHFIFNLLFGKAFFLLPIAFVLAGISFLYAFKNHILRTTIIGSILFLLSALGVAELIFGDKFGGYTGFLISYPIQKMLDFWASLIILSTILLASALIMLNVPLRLRLRRKNKEDEEAEDKGEEVEYKETIEDDLDNNQESQPEEDSEKEGVADEDEEIKTAPSSSSWLPKMNLRPRKLDLESPTIPVDLLEGDRGKPNGGDIKANSNIIKRTLQNFGIDVEMGEVSVGPSVTQYTLRPAEGIKLSKMVALQNDLALALAAHPIRIEAPIPGRSLVGIEIPNRSIAKVGLKSLIASDEFQHSDSQLLIALGRNVSGKGIYANLAKMPHLLIAGATGSGKSVALHSVMASLLYRNTPDQLKFLIIDPKRVELTLYGGIPHLLTQVIIDAKKAILALRWAAQEMERRYDILSSVKARDIDSYHEKIKGTETDESLPFIVVVIDELADIMATYPRELEAAIVRLAQMSRAVGIHLIVSTQRPSVEVITGLIKANITTRMAFKVASQIDSRTVLDMAGAEKLLGNGDMLFLSGETSKPMRIQGSFVSEQEVKRVVKYLEEEYGEEHGEEINFSKDGNNQESILNSVSFEDGDDDDDLYEEARSLVIEAKKASTSYLQRRLKVGYARAARLMDMLEERGVVGPADGAKPRDVLVDSPEEVKEGEENDLSQV